MSLDANGDGKVDEADAVYALRHLFMAGGAGATITAGLVKLLAVWGYLATAAPGIVPPSPCPVCPGVEAAPVSAPTPPIDPATAAPAG